MKSKRSRQIFSAIEPMEGRVLFDTQWGPIPTLIGQDLATTAFPTITGKGVYVAIIDTGVNYNIAALGGGIGPGFKVVGGFDFANNDSDPNDPDGHGTEVASVIGANPFDYGGVHYQGIAPDASIVALRVTGSDGSASDATIDKALKWILNNQDTYPISVVNISLGSGNYAADRTNPTLSADFARLKALNIAVFAASGNSGETDGIAYPAADKSVFAVSSVGPTDVVSDFGQRASLLDLLAPGEQVPVAQRTGIYGVVAGTSFSSPFSVGTAALIQQARPGISPDSLLSIMRASGVPKRDTDGTTLSFPRINVDNALQLATARQTSADNQVGLLAGGGKIAYDQSGELYIAYYDGLQHTVLFATRDTDGLWSQTQLIDDSGADAGFYLSIAIDQTGRPGIAYFDSTNADLKYAHFNGSSWDVAKIDSDKFVGAFPSLVYDGGDHPVIAYWKKSGGQLRMMTTDDDGVWSRTTVDATANVGAWTSIDAAVVSGQQVIAIAYADLTNGDLKYARLLNGAWDLQVVDDTDQIGYTSVNLHNGQAFIAYEDLTSADLKFARRENSAWSTETVFTPGSTGQFASLVFDQDDQAHIAFWSKSKNWAYQSVGTFGNWTTSKVADGGAWISAAASPNGTLTFASLDLIKRNFIFGDLS